MELSKEMAAGADVQDLRREPVVHRAWSAPEGEPSSETVKLSGARSNAGVDFEKFSVARGASPSAKSADERRRQDWEKS